MPSGLPATQELQWAVRADKQGRVGLNTIYNLLVIWEGSRDESHIPLRLSGPRGGHILVLLANSKRRTTPIQPSVGDGVLCCVGCILALGPLFPFPGEFVLWMLVNLGDREVTFFENCEFSS